MSFLRSIYERWTDPDRSYGEAVGWCPTSDEKLEAAEAKLLKHMKSIGPGEWNSGGDILMNGGRILTYSANRRSRKMPLVLLHGFGCASALWCLNVDHLAADRPVYFMDMLGFGRSSRPTFSRVPLEAEDQMVEALEAWRQNAGIEKFLLLGHSLGAYLATSYAMKYPDRVLHLILEDPWGFPEQTGKYNNNSVGVMVMWVLSHFVPPLFPLRWMGPLGRWYVDWLQPFPSENFVSAVSDHKVLTYDYFYHCNARNPTGEVAFHNLMRGVAWARYPMINRIHNLKEDVPMTLLHGQHSWVSKKTSYKLKEVRANSYVDIKVVLGAGHMIHSDMPDEFNSIVRELCAAIESGEVPARLPSDPCLYLEEVDDNCGAETKADGSDSKGKPPSPLSESGDEESVRASMEGEVINLKDRILPTNLVSEIEASKLSVALDQHVIKRRTIPSDQNSNTAEVST